MNLNFALAGFVELINISSAQINVSANYGNKHLLNDDSHLTEWTSSDELNQWIILEFDKCYSFLSIVFLAGDNEGMIR